MYPIMYFSSPGVLLWVHLGLLRISDYCSINFLYHLDVNLRPLWFSPISIVLKEPVVELVKGSFSIVLFQNPIALDFATFNPLLLTAAAVKSKSIKE